MTRRGRWQLVAVLLTAVPRIAAAVWAPPVLSADGERYRNEANPFTPFDVLDGQGPGVLTQLVHLLPLSAAITIQTILTVALWGAVALYAASIASPRMSWPVFLLIHAWSLSPWFVLWDTWVLTESLTLAGCALAAVGVAAARTGAPRGHVVAVVGLAVAVTARPLVGAMLLPLVALAFVWPLSLVRLRALAAPLVAAAVLGIFATWQALAFMAAPSASFSYLPEPESLEQIQATDRFAGRASLPGYLDLARQTGMPPCPAALTAARSGSDPHVLGELRSITNCPDFDAWLATGGLPWTKEFTHNTGPTVRELVSPSYWARESFAPDVPADARMNHLRELAGARWDKVVIAVNAVMVCATALASVAALVLARGQRLFFAAALVIVAAVSVYAWGTDGIEYWRHLLPAFPVVFTLAVTLLGTTPLRRGQHLPR